MNEPTHLRFSVWHENEDRYPTRDPYVEWFWTPVLGPAAIIMLRRADDLDGHTLTVIDASRMLGLGDGNTWNRGVLATIRRLNHFNFAMFHLDGTLGNTAIRNRAPILPARSRRLLPLELAKRLETHERASTDA